MNNIDSINSDRLVYTYNPLQAQYYIDRGIFVRKTGINPKTNNPYWAFSFNESTNAWNDWCTRKH